MDLKLADFVLFLLLGSAGLVLMFSIGSRFLSNRAENRSLSHRIICRLCLYAFENNGSGKTADCPHCGVATERGRSRKLG
jgi:rRNA maturation endonuclease Nob1